MIDNITTQILENNDKIAELDAELAAMFDGEFDYTQVKYTALGKGEDMNLTISVQQVRDIIVEHKNNLKATNVRLKTRYWDELVVK